jgi:asparagine synthase (glutamine-hydrolysing)
MCGICGVVGIGDSKEVEAVVRRMTAALRHRGPDDEGMLAVPHVALGIRRLSIIDLAGGHQPVFNEDRSVAVMFNGEIYNFQDLGRELQAKGHSFRTRSDTESLVHAYEEWGEDCVRHLRGMFAFAVLDMRPNQGGGPRVFLARDRLGIKPLYYAFADGALLFASEVRALLASGHMISRLSEMALDSYLLFGSVAEPTTLIEGIFSIPPGHSMSFPAIRPARWPQPQTYWGYGEAARGGAGIAYARPGRGGGRVAAGT